MRRQPSNRDLHYKAPAFHDLVGRVAANLRALRATRVWTREEAAFRCGEMRRTRLCQH